MDKKSMSVKLSSVNNCNDISSNPKVLSIMCRIYIYISGTWR